MGTLLLIGCLVAGGAVTMTGCDTHGSPAAKGFSGKYSAKTVELTATIDIEDEKLSPTPLTGQKAEARKKESRNSVIDASLTLFQQTVDGKENTLLSPLSLLMALTMMAQGTNGETKAQIEAAFNQEMDGLAAYFADYVSNLPQSENAKLHIANSVWMRDDEDRLTVDEVFLRKAKALFQAQIFKAAFDENTVADMNGWCSKMTDGMISEIVQKIRPEEVMHLMNAICFDAKWLSPYEKTQISEDAFMTETGETQKHEYLHSTEFGYIEGAHETGFVKPYQDGYAFVALLPTEGMSMRDYSKTLTGKRFRQLWNNISDEPVVGALPSFTASCGLDLLPTLQNMGITTLFNPNSADLSAMATSTYGNVYITGVNQKTYIEVDAAGTRAAAITDIVAGDSAMPVVPKTVRLTRPFVYGIVDEATGTPIFLGTMMTLD